MSVDNSGRGSTLGLNLPRNRVSRNTESPSPSKDKPKSSYRQAFAEANILITEGFLNLHPNLPIAVKNLLAPRPCLPADMKNLFPGVIPAECFYDERPSDVHTRQEEAIRYLLKNRPKEMHFHSLSGRTKAAWSNCTKDKVFLPLLDPQGEMNKLIEDVTLKFPGNMENVAKALTEPKPDILFGAYLNRATIDSDVYESQDPGIFSLDHHVMSGLTAQEFSEISCGAVDEQFCFPTVAIERKSNSDSVYFAENQLLGSLCCIYASQYIAKQRFDETLPHLALGIVNVGNWVELWGCWPRNLRGTKDVSAWHIYDFHMFNVRGCVELASFCLNLHVWMKKYQDQLYKALMRHPATPDITSVNPLKRQRPEPRDPFDQPYPKRTAVDRDGAGVSPQSMETTAEGLDAPEIGQGNNDSEDLNMHSNACFDSPASHFEFDGDENSDIDYDYSDEHIGTTTADIIQYFNVLPNSLKY